MNQPAIGDTLQETALAPRAGVPGFIAQAMVAAVVVLVAIAVYDVFVRQPRTPRLAVVDIAQLYGLAHDQAARRALRAAEAAASDPAGVDQPGQTPGRLYRDPQEFGPAFSQVLEKLSGDCRCTLVAMAAVFGADSTVPDYTAEAARRMGLDPGTLDVREAQRGER